MNPLLISGFGTSIYVDKRKLIIYNRLDEGKLEFYPHQIDHDSIIVDGHTGNITFDAIRWLMKHDINLKILNWNGNLLGTTLPKEPKNGRLRVMQYQAYLDPKRRFAIASKIVEAKIAHSKNLLAQLAHYYKEVSMSNVTNAFRAGDNFENCVSAVDVLLNYEGRIATIYLGLMTRVFNRLHPEFNFVKRGTKSYSWNMNASDEVNALLNYGYAILESEIRKDINAVGLDPSVGFLHELAQSKTPLVYDLQELYRWLVDLSVLQLLEEKKLKKSDFIVTENYHIRLKPATTKLLIEKIRLNFNRAAKCKAGKNHTYQSILLDNVQQLANHILGKRAELQVNVPSFKIQRNDVLEVRQRILTMTPAERKRRGINKSTLWYQKRQLGQGKSVKIYGKALSKIA